MIRAGVIFSAFLFATQAIAQDGLNTEELQLEAGKHGGAREAAEIITEFLALKDPTELREKLNMCKSGEMYDFYRGFYFEMSKITGRDFFQEPAFDYYLRGKTYGTCTEFFNFKSAGFQKPYKSLVNE